MKKLLAMLLCAVMCVTLLASCGSVKHEHTNGDWEYNESQHWRKAFCSWDAWQLNIVSEDHIDKNNDGVCDVCPCYVESDISRLSGITRIDYENYTVFKFENFTGKATLKMERVGLEEDRIYYTGKLSKGLLQVNYDRGPWDSTETLYTFAGNVIIPAENTTVAKIDQTELDIIFDAQQAVSGEIIISFIPIEGIGE